MTKLILPTLSQAEWAEREIGVIIHLDLPVFSNDVRYNFREHYGDPLPAELFNPDDMDVESWIRAARDLGAKYAVLVAKHCTGFCLWPTRAHGYSVASSPWKDGQGDVVREFVDACRKYDVLPGLYYSVSCNQYMNVDNPGLVRDRDPEKQRAYNEMALEQLTELWTNYGELFEIWFDGGCLPPEEGGPDVAALLSRLQPNAVVFQGPRGLPSRLRWVGNERGVADENCSSIMNEGAELLDGTRIDLLENKVVLAVPEGNPKSIESFDKLADQLGAGEVFLAIGNSDVPVGQYTRKIFAHYGMDEQSLADAGVLTYGSNVKEVTTQVSEGAVDCGVIYATDAYSAGLESVDEATADMCGQVIYPAAVLRNSAHPDEAKAFLDYLTGEDAGRVFESVGFTPLA